MAYFNLRQIISSVSCFIKPDFVHLTFAFFLIASVIMKKVKYRYVLIGLTSYIVLSLVLDIVWLSMDFSVKEKVLHFWTDLFVVEL